MDPISTGATPGAAEVARSRGRSLEEEYQRCCHALERQEEELRKCRAQVWMARHWWEQRLQWLFPASFQPTLWPPDRPLPSSAEPRFPVEIRRLDQYPERRPVFILGSVRSGTSAMCGALRVGAKFFGWEEGFLFATLPGLMKAVNETWDKAREGGAGFSMEHTALPHADIYSLLNAMVRGCDRMYAAWAEQKGASRWVEKTPDSGMMLAAPLVQHVYPQSRIILMHRHPIKVVLSMLRWFPEWTLEQAIGIWAAYTRTWREVRPYLDSRRIMELSQASLSLQTDQTVDSLTRFLDLTQEQTAAVGAYFRRERPKRTDSSEDRADLYLEDMNWPDEVKIQCLEAWEDLASGWGYRLTKSSAFCMPGRNLSPELPVEAVDPGPTFLVPLQPRGQGPLLLIALGQHSDLVFARNLVRHLGADIPVYGMQSPLKEGVSQAFDRIEELGAYFAGELLGMYPQRPWRLLGYSYGACVAVETALQLHKRGQEVGYLGLVEGWPQDRANRVQGFWETVARYPWILACLPNYLVDQFHRTGVRKALRAWRATLRRKARHLARAFPLRKSSPGSVERNGSNGSDEDADRFLAALLRYQAPSYPGHITLFRGSPELLTPLPRDFGWRRLAEGGLTVHQISGADHQTILQEPYIGMVAQRLKADLAKRKRS